jgi:hypothetical protein
LALAQDAPINSRESAAADIQYSTVLGTLIMQNLLFAARDADSVVAGSIVGAENEARRRDRWEHINLTRNQEKLADFGVDH